VVPLAWPPSWSQGTDRYIGLVVLGFAYFLLAKLGLTLASLHPSASPVWPPSGLALAAAMLLGPGVWPSVAAGAFLANATTFGSVFTSLAIAVGNTSEAVLTAWLIQRVAGGPALFQTPAGVARFAGLTLAPGTMISATVGAGSLALAGHAETAKFDDIWITWWLGDVGGQLLVAPVVVLWAQAPRWRLNGTELQRLARLLLATAAVGLVAFSPLVQQTAMRGSLAFLAIAPMLWAALRYDQRHTATAALVISAFAIWGTLANGGPFARPSLNESFLLILTFVISTAVPSLVLSADVAMRRRSEERYRTLVENANDLVATLDPDFRITSANPAVERIFGYTPAEMLGEPLSRYLPEDQIVTHKALLQRKLDAQSSTQYEMEVVGKNGKRLILEMNLRLVLDDGGGPAAIHVMARDISERKDAEARQTLLVRELQHRTKNMLAVVQSIVSNTLAGSRNLGGARDAILGRLHALGRAQEFVASGPTGGVPLRELVEAELTPFAARTSIQGAPLIVSGTFAQMFALVIHELATNAAKYGSLSTPKGRVLVNWQIEQRDAEPALVFTWLERDGPKVAAPAAEGFGSRLISTALGGTPEVSFEPEGFSLAVAVPLSQVMKASRDGASTAAG